MKKLMLSTAVLAVLATAAAADNHAASSLFRGDADPMMIPASEFIGMRVYASEAAIEAEEYAGLQEGWEDIGEINDVILARDGSVDSVLVDIGGFLGVGERQVAVDMQAIRFVADSATAEDLDDFFLVMNADRATLEGAPAYMMGEDSAMADPQKADGADATMTAQTETTAPAAGTTTAAEAVPSGTDAAASDVPMTAELTAEELTGAPVYDAENNWIGEVSELILTPEGKVSQAVIDVGGFLGIGAKPVALSLDDLAIQRAEGSDDLRLQVALTKEQLEAMPEHAG